MRLETQDEFIEQYSKRSGLNKKSVKMIVDSMADFLQYCIEENIEFRVSNLFELYFSNMKSRETVKVGTNERITLPPVRKAKLRLSNKLRRKQGDMNKIMRPILEEIENS